jgi:rhodanese-related sulfurtransferase
MEVESMKAKRVLVLSVVALLVAAMSLGWSGTLQAAEKAKTRGEWKFHDLVSVDFVKDWAKVPKPDNVVVIDSRPQHKYVKGHIPTAISIPDSKFDQLKDQLPEDKSTILIFYCGGLKCKLSHKSAMKAEKLGYQNVKVYAEGFPGWMKAPGTYAEISVEYVAKEIDGNKAVVIDARPHKPKFVKGHIPTAISIPNSQFDELKGKLPQDKNTPLIFYCGGFKCKLSHKSAVKAMDLGYTNVKVFAAGYPAWKKFAGAGQSVKIASGTEEGSIEIASFEKIMKDKPESILLVDVRATEEYEAGTFKSAVNIPTDNLEKNIKSLPSDKPIIFVCNTGALSGEAYYMVKDLRPEIKDVYYLEAEVSYKKDGSYEIKKTP